MELNNRFVNNLKIKGQIFKQTKSRGRFNIEKQLYNF
jgi:hypothetical protein